MGSHSPKYDIVEKRTRNLPKSTVNKGKLFDDEEFAGQATPCAKYDLDRGEKITQPKSLFAKIYDKRFDQDEHKLHLKKDKGPDIGTYDSPRAFNKT